MGLEELVRRASRTSSSFPEAHAQGRRYSTSTASGNSQDGFGFLRSSRTPSYLAGPTLLVPRPIRRFQASHAAIISGLIRRRKTASAISALQVGEIHFDSPGRKSSPRQVLFENLTPLIHRAAEAGARHGSTEDLTARAIDWSRPAGPARTDRVAAESRARPCCCITSPRDYGVIIMNSFSSCCSR